MESWCPNKFKLNLNNIPPLDPSSIKSSPILFRQEKPRNRKFSDVVTAGRQEALGSGANLEDIVKFGRQSVRVFSAEKVHPEPGEDGTEFRIQDTLSAKLLLHEVCVAKRWNSPVYQCCKEEGPIHLTLFIFKVVIEIRESSTILECYGAPHSRKKAAAEHAAAGALWYLQNLGHFPLKKQKKRNSK